jgi:hypothetical protein
MSHAVLLAYLDPGAGSLVLQALVGGGAGLFVFLRQLWKAYRAGAVQPTVGQEAHS